MAEVLSSRWKIDLDANAAKALTNMLAASQHVDQGLALRAAGHMLPALMRSKEFPISSVIVTTFPYVYFELAREDDVPNLLRFISFLDWDCCKAARHELVDAFLSAEAWAPSDFARTAWRCGDLERFVRRLMKDGRGEGYSRKIEVDLPNLPVDCAREFSAALRSYP
jgi:hypothetical protein